MNKLEAGFVQLASVHEQIKKDGIGLNVHLLRARVESVLNLWSDGLHELNARTVTTSNVEKAVDDAFEKRTL